MFASAEKRILPAIGILEALLWHGASRGDYLCRDGRSTIQG